ncbi:MAG: hypothetical protein ABFS37_11985 [Acidobacteriota bacterium]
MAELVAAVVGLPAMIGDRRTSPRDGEEDSRDLRQDLLCGRLFWPVADELEGLVADLEVGIGFPDDFTIYLNPSMIDVTKEVVVRVDGEEVYRGRPQPDLACLLESLDGKLDRTLLFDRKIPIPAP